MEPTRLCFRLIESRKECIVDTNLFDMNDMLPTKGIQHGHMRYRTGSANPIQAVRFLISEFSLTNMAGLIQRTAQAINDMWQSIWHESGRAEKVVIAIVLLITGLAIPVIPIVWIARIIAN